MRKRHCINPLPSRGGDECSSGAGEEWEPCGQYLCSVWTTDTRLGFQPSAAYFHYFSPDYLYTNECDLHPLDYAGIFPANYILGAVGNDPQLQVTMDFGFSVTITGVYLKNSQNSGYHNQ